MRNVDCTFLDFRLDVFEVAGVVFDAVLLGLNGFFEFLEVVLLTFVVLDLVVEDLFVVVFGRLDFLHFVFNGLYVLHGFQYFAVQTGLLLNGFLDFLYDFIQPDFSVFLHFLVLFELVFKAFNVLYCLVLLFDGV